MSNSPSTEVINIGAPTDITRQMVSLARFVDRLPDGNYTILISKCNRLEPWPAMVFEGHFHFNGQEPLRELELKRV